LQETIVFLFFSEKRAMTYLPAAVLRDCVYVIVHFHSTH